MFDQMTDDEFERHVTIVSHALAMRRFHRDCPTATRATAWAFAVDHWPEFVDVALDYLSLQVVRDEDRQTVRNRLN